MGKCAICGEDFCAGVLKDLMGMKSGISQFSVGFVDQTLYIHDPECKEIAKQAFDTSDPETVLERLPDGPLKKVLEEAIENQKET